VLDLPEGTNASQLVERFISFRKQLKKGRFFAYLHYMDVHVPYHRNRCTNIFTGDFASGEFAPGAVTVHKTRYLTSRGEVSEADREYVIGLYDGQIRFVDESVMTAVEFLREEALFDNTVLFIISDHGEEFWDHGNFEHGHSLYDELVHIPMIVFGGGIRSGQEDLEISLLDFAPTLVDMAGLPPGDYDFAGRSFLDLLKGYERAGKATPLFAMGTLYGHERYCLIEDGLKMILNTPNAIGKLALVGNESPAGVELYDLSADPGEADDLMKAAGQVDAETIARLKQNLEDLSKVAPRFGGRRVLPGKKLKDDLRSLGYL
jgi:arylsulfatase A-like enzyme